MNRERFIVGLSKGAGTVAPLLFLPSAPKAARAPFVARPRDLV
jgi:hypothetical protein